MLVQIFTLKFHATTEQFDDRELQEFIKDKEVLSVREHFFIKHETTRISCRKDSSRRIGRRDTDPCF